VVSVNGSDSWKTPLQPAAGCCAGFPIPTKGQRPLRPHASESRAESRVTATGNRRKPAFRTPCRQG